MPTIERTPLQQALLQHLGPGRDHLIPICAEAISLGQLGANGEYHLFSRVLHIPQGQDLTVEEVITCYSLNSFIEWGGKGSDV